MQDTIAVIFDFDDTLAPDSTSSFLDNMGVDVPRFWSERVNPRLDDGWDTALAYLFEMIEESKSRKANRITRAKLRSWGRKVEFFNGVTRIFNVLKRHAASVNPNVNVEFYMISGGIGDIVRYTKISKHFTDIWACEFSYSPQGAIRFPQTTINFTEKTRYLFQISKGIHGPASRAKPFEVNRKIRPTELRIPFDQMIFVGDGYTDIPCFSVIRANEGVPIAVYDQQSRTKWGRAWGFIEDQRVSNIAPADYGKNSALRGSLLMAIENMASNIALRASSYQG